MKQFAVEDFDRIESSKAITMMTPEPDGGFYKDAEVEAFVRKSAMRTRTTNRIG